PDPYRRGCRWYLTRAWVLERPARTAPVGRHRSGSGRHPVAHLPMKPTLTDTLRARAAERPLRIVLPETADPRTLQAADFLRQHGICIPVLPEPETDPNLERYAQHLWERRKAKGMTLDQARELAHRP